MAEAICWADGHILPAREATVSVLDHGLLYGDGVFEGIRFYRGRPFRLREHLLRLARSARAIALALPYGEDELADAVAQTVAAYGETEGYLRLLVTRGVGALGIDPASCGRPSVFVIASPLAMVSEAEREHGIRVIVAATRRLSPDGLDPRIKSLNYLNHILARMEARRSGAQEAILLNAAGHVAEGSADNVFAVRDGVVYTPPTSDGALEGVTRGVVMELAQRRGMILRESSLAPYDLHTADEVFLTGTGAELIPVREVDGRVMTACPGPVFRALRADFQDLAESECGG